MTYQKNCGCQEQKYFNNATTVTTQDCIYETVKKVDQLQKEAVIQSACETCEDSLCAQLYDTKPVSFYLSNGEAFKVEVPETHCHTTYFRIQELRGDCVVLRILTYKDCVWNCTNFTAVLNLKCVCGIQCFPPICCPPCSKAC